MSDYIDKQAALDGLNEQIAYCDKALGSFEISMKDEYAVKVEKASLMAFKEKLENIPAADAVPVVRCRDCKNLGTFRGKLYCRHNCGIVEPKENDFCSRGERKE